MTTRREAADRDVSELLAGAGLDPARVWSEALMAHADGFDHLPVGSFSTGFALACFTYGTEPEDRDDADFDPRPVPDTPLTTTGRPA